MTFSILSSPELGIPHWPLQTHTLPSASMLCVPGGCRVGNTHGLPGLAGRKSRGGRRVNGGRYFPAASLFQAGCVPLLTAWLLKLHSPVSSLQVLATAPSLVCSSLGVVTAPCFTFFNICSFIWLHRVLDMAPGVFAASCRIFRCCVRTVCLWCGLWYLQLTGAVAMARRLTPQHVGS